MEPFSPQEFTTLPPHSSLPGTLNTQVTSSLSLSLTHPIMSPLIHNLFPLLTVSEIHPSLSQNPFHSSSHLIGLYTITTLLNIWKLQPDATTFMYRTSLNNSSLPFLTLPFCFTPTHISYIPHHKIFSVKASNLNFFLKTSTTYFIFAVSFNSLIKFLVPK